MSLSGRSAETTLLVASGAGCRVFRDGVECQSELAGLPIGALAPTPEGECLTVVSEDQIWRRAANGAWSKVADVGIPLQSLVSVGDEIFAGGMDEAAIVRVCANGRVERLSSFDHVPGRDTWIANGPPLGVRSLAAIEGGATVLAAVHVGGIPRLADQGASWAPTIPIEFDVHEVRGHPALPGFAAAATTVGLCVSQDGGQTWKVFSEGLETTNLLAVAVLENEVLFGICDGPFAKRAQVWRWRIGTEQLEQVRDGLPEWLSGKVDTGWIAAGNRHAAILDGGGNLWLSAAGSTGWEHVATGIAYSSGLLFV